MDKLVSVIVPVYNVEKYLDACVESLIHQTYQNIEIILVDDGSPDQSAIMCDAFRENDDRIMVIHKENGGLSDARNAGIKASTGEYILFLDSDDFLELDAIEKLIQVIDQSNADVVIFGYYTDFVDNDETIYKSIKISGIDGSFDVESYHNIPVNSKVIGLLGYAWNKLYKSGLIKDNNFMFTKGISLVEDVLFNGPLMEAAKKVTFIQDEFVHYLQRDRVTLGAKLYDNHMELKMMAVQKIESLLKHWIINDETITRVIGEVMFNTVKAIVKLLSQSEEYDKKTKVVKLKRVLKDSETFEHLSTHKPQTFKDRLLLFLMKKYQARFLLTIYR